MFPEDELNQNASPAESEPVREAPPVPPRPPVSPYSASPYEAPQSNPQPAYQYQYQPQPPKPKKVRKSGAKKVLLSILALLVVAGMVTGGCLITASTVNRQHQESLRSLESKISSLESALAQQKQDAPVFGSAPAPSGDALTPGEVYRRNVDSVVAISCAVKSTSFGRTVEGKSSGSGFILTDTGYVVTNYHVIENASSIQVLLNDGRKLDATVVGRDSTNDVAVLKAETEGETLKPVTLGSSSALSIGDMVVAIGNPLGTLNATQTVGYVSGVDREVTTDNTIISMLQTDVAINPGNSGGPLFNMRGEVVGITTAKYSGTTPSGVSIEGISFAIPIDDVQSVIGDLQTQGYVSGAYLGVTVQNTDAQSAEYFGIPQGARVISVEPDGAADKAGLREKDIIIQVGDISVSDVTELTRALRKFKPGDETDLTVIRGGERLELAIVLGERPNPQEQEAEQSAQQPADGSYEEWYDYFRRYFGIG